MGKIYRCFPEDCFGTPIIEFLNFVILCGIQQIPMLPNMLVSY